MNGNSFGRDGSPLNLNSNRNSNFNNNSNRTSSFSHHPSSSTVRDTPTDDSSQTSSQDAPTISSTSTSLTSNNRPQRGRESPSVTSNPAANGGGSRKVPSSSRLSGSKESASLTKRHIPGPMERARIKAARALEEQARRRSLTDHAPPPTKRRRESRPGVARPSSDEDEGDDLSSVAASTSRSQRRRSARKEESESESESFSEEEEATPVAKRRAAAPAWKRKVSAYLGRLTCVGGYGREFGRAAEPIVAIACDREEEGRKVAPATSRTSSSPRSLYITLSLGLPIYRSLFRGVQGQWSRRFREHLC